MAKNGYRTTHITSQMVGTAVTNTTTPTSILPGGAIYSFLANFFDVAGVTIEWDVRGIITSPVTPGGTLTLDARLGAVIIFTSQAITLNATAMTNQTFIFRGKSTLQQIDTAAGGTTATFKSVAEFISRDISGVGASPGAVGTLLCPETSPAAGTGFDMTGSQAFNIFATWQVALSTYSIQSHLFTLESLN